MATFEEQLAELEKVVDRLERGELPLEENVNLFERGTALANACREQLAAAESRVQVLLDVESKGCARIEDLDLDEDDDAEDEAADDEIESDGRL
jgi:exodeoxyribonuclease VII small subunit